MTANAYKTIDEIVAFASTRIKGVTREDRMIFRNWVWNAEKQLGYSNVHIGYDSIPVQNLTARKPDDYRKLKDIALLLSDGTEVMAKIRGYSKRVHEDLIDDRNRKVDVYEDDNFFHLGSNGGNVTHVKIEYYGLPLDNNGYPKIPEHHEPAISQYIKYLHLDKEGTNQSAIVNASVEWKLLAAAARGKNKMPSEEEGRKIAKEWMSMIAQNLNKNLY